MSEELPPSLFNIIRGDLRDTRTEISLRLDQIARDMVTQAMLTQVQQNQKERDDRQDARIRDLEGKEEERQREYRQLAEDGRKTRSQQMFAIGLAAFGALLSVIGGVVLWTVTAGIQQFAGGG